MAAAVFMIIWAPVREAEVFAGAWRVIMGLLFVLVVLYLPRGFAGLAHDLVDRLLARRKAPSQQAVGVSDASQLAEGAPWLRSRSRSMVLGSTSAASRPATMSP